MVTADLFGGSMGRLLIAIGLLCVATYFTQESPWRYVTAANDLLTGPSSPTRAAEWDRTAAGVDVAFEHERPVILLEAAAGDGPSAVRARLSLPRGLDGILVGVEAKADRLVPGRNGWETGRVQINSFDAKGRSLWYWPKDVAVLSGRTGWLRFETVIPATDDLKIAYLLLYNGATSGVMAVRRLRVAGVMERPAFAVLRTILIASWILLGLRVAWSLVRSGRRIAARAPMLVLVAAALVGILMPQPYLKQLSAPVEDFVRSWAAPRAMQAATSPDGADESPGAIAPRSDPAAQRLSRHAGREPVAFELGLKHAGHFAVFAGLALAVRLAFPQVPVLALAIYLLLFAVVTESLQLFLVTRSARLLDLAADAAGIALASGLLTLARWLMAVGPGRWSRNASRGPGP